MASTVRSPGSRESAVGYIHSVSPVKTSDAKKTRYFNALLQTGRDECHDMVFFQTELHRQFTQAAQNLTSVEVTNITRCFTYRNRKGFDYKSCRFTQVIVTEVPFPPKRPDARQRKRIDDVKAIPHSHHTGEVRGQELAAGSSPNTVPRRGVESSIQSEVIAVGLTRNFSCRSCYKRQPAAFNSRQPFQRCEGCQLLSKSCRFLATTSGVLHVGTDGVETALTLNNSVLESFLETHRLTHLLDDTERLEMHLLTLEKVQISFNAERFITKLSLTEPSSTGAPVPPPAATACYSPDEAGSSENH